MSMGSWYILITKLYESLKLSQRGEGGAADLLQVEERRRRRPRR